jgi:aromatic-L-amino-acid/L-tryptophan decarboxylase
MNELEVSNQDLSRLAEEALDLAKSYWQSLEVRRAYPTTSGKQTTELFSREWPEHGRGQEVLQDFKIIAEHGRPSTGRFFGYIFVSGEPIGALGELLAAALNQNVTAWRSQPLIIPIIDNIGCSDDRSCVRSASGTKATSQPLSAMSAPER